MINGTTPEHNVVSNYISKPLSEEKVWGVLNTLNISKEVDVFDPTSLESMREEKRAILLKLYLKLLNEEITLIEQGVIEKDIEKIKHSSHKMKGSSGAVGAKNIRTIFIHLEKLVKGSEIPTLEDLENLRIAEKEFIDTVSTYYSL